MALALGEAMRLKRKQGSVMKWMEVIEMRSVGNNRRLLEIKLKDLIKEFERESKQWQIKVYIHISINSDYSIHLFHDSNKADINGSPLGLQLISTLKGYGLVNHNIWVEQTGV